ncbi:MAG: TetR/AcrR family transcriptional regulator [Pseudomonadota bacterium]
MPTANTAKTAARATRRRSPESQEQFRRELVLYAKELYRSQGYEGLTLRALTSAFGMSPMAFYAYFPNKQSMVKHIWLDIFRELFDALLAAGRSTHSPAETLRAHVQANLDYWEGNEDHFRMAYLSNAEAPGSEPIALYDEPLYVQLLDLLRERVLACARGKMLAEAELQLLTDFVRIKLFGYLFAAIVLRRYRFADKAALKGLVIDDVMLTVDRMTA